MFRRTVIVLREVHMERVEEDSMKTEAGLHSEKKLTAKGGGGEIHWSCSQDSHSL